MGQGELGEAMGIDPSIFVTLLNPLEAGGFLTRDRDPADRRSSNRGRPPRRTPVRRRPGGSRPRSRLSRDERMSLRPSVASAARQSDSVCA